MINKIIKSFLNGYIAVVFLSFFVVVIKPVINPENDTFIPLLFSQLLMFDLLFWLSVFVPSFIIVKIHIDGGVSKKFYLGWTFVFSAIAIKSLGSAYKHLGEDVIFTISPSVFSELSPGYLFTSAVITILIACVFLPLFPPKKKEKKES